MLARTKCSGRGPGYAGMKEPMLGGDNDPLTAQSPTAQPQQPLRRQSREERVLTVAKKMYYLGFLALYDLDQHACSMPPRCAL